MTISLPKLILLVVLVVAVWYVTRVLNRGAFVLERRRGAAARTRGRAGRGPGNGGQGAIEDLIPCRTCGAYVPSGAHNCGKPACPQPR